MAMGERKTHTPHNSFLESTENTAWQLAQETGHSMGVYGRSGQLISSFAPGDKQPAGVHFPANIMIPSH
jgi:hypothetical protein